MDADEEARSRQYKGTAMSDDEVSKVYKIQAFGFLPKATINKMLIITVSYCGNEHYFCLHFAVRSVSFDCGVFCFDKI